MEIINFLLPYYQKMVDLMDLFLPVDLNVTRNRRNRSPHMFLWVTSCFFPLAVAAGLSPASDFCSGDVDTGGARHAGDEHQNKDHVLALVSLFSMVVEAKYRPLADSRDMAKIREPPG